MFYFIQDNILLNKTQHHPVVMINLTNTIISLRLVTITVSIYKDDTSTPRYNVPLLDTSNLHIFSSERNAERHDKMQQILRLSAADQGRSLKIHVHVLQMSFSYLASLHIQQNSPRVTTQNRAKRGPK